MREAYRETTEQLLERYQTRQSGLTAQEAEAARRRYGRNELVTGKKKSIAAIFLGQFGDFLVLILIGAAVISAFLGDIESTVVILAVITMNAVLDTVQQQKAEKSLNSLKQLSAPHAKVRRGNEMTVVPASEIVAGDIVCVEAGDFICADGRILESAGLKVNESALTGESLAVEKRACQIEEEVPLGDRVNMVYSGSFVTYGRASFLVTEVGMHTQVGRIADLLKNTAERKTPLQQNLDQFGRRLSYGILAVCAVVFGISVWQGEPLLQAFLFAVALAVAAIPEALSSIVTIVLAFGTNKMAKEHAIIRRLQAVEGLGSVAVICSDKTGTLTQNKMTVCRAYVNGEELDTKQTDIRDKETLALFDKLIGYSVLCSDATNYEGVEIGDPTEVALVNLAEYYGVSVKGIREKYPRIAELPFDSDRKLMTTIHETDEGCRMITKGAVDVLLERIEWIGQGDGVRAVTEEDKRAIREQNRRFSENGLRVLAIAYRKWGKDKVSESEEDHYTFLGLLAMMDPPREEAKAAVAECVAAGICPVMITGDHKITAAAIAREIGILTDGKKVVEGMELEKLTDEELEEMVKDVAVYARVSPEHKIRIVRAWQKQGKIVAMTGDGVNDAPALKQADVGVAMGITGSEVAKDAASMILTDDNFATIVKAVENGRNVYGNIKKSIQFLLSGNMAGILAVLYASAAGLAVPFAPVHLLFINLLTDSLPAIALGLDPHSKEVMEQPPREKTEGILTKRLFARIALEGLVIGIFTMTAYHIGLRQSAATASTMAFLTLCLSRLVHGFNSKSEHPVLFTGKMWNNRYLTGAFVIGFLLLNAVIFIPGLHHVFAVETLSGRQLLAVYGLSVLNLPVIQLAKWILKRR